MKTSHFKTYVGAILLLVFLPFAIPMRSSARQLVDPSKSPMANAESIAAITRDWLNGKQSSPGVSVEIKEVDRSTDGGQLKVQYHVFVKGGPKDQTYTFSAWPINAAGPVVEMRGLSILADGTVACAGRTPEQCGDKARPDDPVEFTFMPGKGEVFRLVLISADLKWKVFFGMVPDPIIKTDKSCSLEVIRLTAKFELTLVRGKGFQPGEELTFTSKSYDETHVNKVKADANGEYVTALLPAVKNHPNGTTALQLKGAAGAPDLSLPWGQ